MNCDGLPPDRALVDAVLTVVLCWERVVLGYDDEKSLAEKLSTYKDQQYTVEFCGPFAALDRGRRESMETLLALVGALQKAGWKLQNDKAPTWSRCGELPGISIFISFKTNMGTVSAGRALGDELQRILPFQRGNPTLDMGVLEADADDPKTLARDNPDSVVILVSEQPLPEKKDDSTNVPKKP